MADLKLNNEEYEVIEAPEMVANGDSNKLKLQVATNMAIRSVQMTFISEKKNSVVASLASVKDELVKEKDPEVKKELEDKMIELSFAVDLIEREYAKAVGLYKKAFVYGVKILKLPEDKFDELAMKSEVTITNDANEQEIITTAAFQDMDRSVSDAIDNADDYFQNEILEKNGLVFDQIDSRAVQDAVNENMTSLDNLPQGLSDVVVKAKQTYIDNVNKADINDIYSQLINGTMDEDKQITETSEVVVKKDDEQPLHEVDDLDDIKRLIEEAKARRDTLEKENDDAKEALRLANEAKETALKEKEEAEQAREEARTRAERYNEQVNVYIEELKSLNEANAQLATSASETRNLADQVSNEVSKTAEATAEIRKETEGYEASSSASVNALREFRNSILGSTQDSVEVKGPVK